MLLHIGYHAKTRRFKFAEDINTLSPDVTEYFYREVSGLATLKDCVSRLEFLGYRVCIDLADHFYETGREE